MAAQTNFIDIATIWLHAGKGGDGAVSFHREKFVAAGGPDGGDGGRGGDIIFVVDDHLTTLMDFRYKRKYVAPEGGKGGASLCHGKNAENLVIKVPLGTVIKDAESGLVIAEAPRAAREDHAARKRPVEEAAAPDGHEAHPREYALGGGGSAEQHQSGERLHRGRKRQACL